ncbi:MAG: hypothetical protein ABIH11_08200 [Candidatus Altiarchaeota archaeon]
MDVIEGVKYGFEPPDAFHLVGVDGLKRIEDECRSSNTHLNLLLLTTGVPEGVNLFIGSDPPGNAVHLGRVISTLSFFLEYAFTSDYFSDGGALRNINPVSDGTTLLASTAAFSINAFKTL